MSIFAYHFCNVYYHMISQNTSIIINHYQLIDWVLSETCEEEITYYIRYRSFIFDNQLWLASLVTEISKT